MGNKQLLFSVTKSDCRWDYFRCPGKGGQKVNKTSSGVRCTHPPSGAVGQACDERYQPQNKKLAFQRMANSEKFKQWYKIEVARKTGQLQAIERQIQQEMTKIKTEIVIDGKWVEE